LNKREGQLIRFYKNKCVNKYIAGLTHKESCQIYLETHKEERKESSRKYRETNKEIIAEKARQTYILKKNTE